MFALAFRINTRVEGAVLGDGDLYDRDRKHGWRQNVETTITATWTEIRQSPQYECVITGQINTQSRSIQRIICQHDSGKTESCGKLS